MDPYEFAEPVDALKQLPKGFFDDLRAAKWQVGSHQKAACSLHTLAITLRLL